MARCTIGLIQVLAVVKLDVETSEWRKTLHSTGLGIGMTDRAHRARGIGKLRSVTACTRQVFVSAGTDELCRIIITAMTEQAR